MSKRYLSFALIVGLASCAKDEKLDSSFHHAIEDGYWQVTDVIQNPDITDPSKVYSSVYSTAISACEQDNYYAFKSDSVAYYYSGTNKCSVSEGDYTARGYIFPSNEDSLFIFEAPLSDNNIGAVWGAFKMTQIDSFTVENRNVSNGKTESTIYIFKKK